MKRQMIVEHLQLAERHVAAGEKIISRQKALIMELERDSHDTATAKQLLVQFVELQAMHEADVARLSQELIDYDTPKKG